MKRIEEMWSENWMSHKAKQINPIQYIYIDFDGFRFILDKIKQRPKTIKQLIKSSNLVSRDFIYERVRELEKLGFIEKTGRVEHTKRKNKMRGHYFGLTPKGQFFLMLKKFSGNFKKEKSYPEELRYAVF
jgi:predicted transcriptional regulator